MKSVIWVANILLVVLGTQALANTSRDKAVPLGHCYHWLQSAKGYMDFKYAYAKDNGNELTFFTSPATSNGSVAGPGLYCAKSPSESYGYGDRMIRIELVDDVVMLDALTGKKYCGHNGNFYANDAECQSKDWDIKHYNSSPDWYVIQNPRAVKSWSATTPSVIQDLRNEMSYGGGGYTAHANAVINVINADVQANGVRDMVNARARMGFAEIVKSDKLLRALPALTVLAEITRPENEKIDAQVMAQVLDKTVTRILEDDFLPWSDVKPAIKSDKKVKKAFVNGIQKQLAALASGTKSQGQKNFDVMLLFSGQKNSGITPEQIKVLITETFKNPSNFGQTRFEDGDLSADLKKGLIAELTARLQVPETKNDLSLLASLVTFVSINSIDAQIKKDVTAMYYEFIKSMKTSKFALSDRKTKYPLGDTVQIATQLCQANIAAYKLVNKDLHIGSGEVKIGVGQISNISNAAAFCQQQASLMDILATMPSKGATQIQTLKGQIAGIEFKFAVLDQESMEAQLRSFYKKNDLKDIKQLDIYLNDTQLMVYNNYYAIYADEDSLIKGVFQYVNNTKGLFARSQVMGLQTIAAKGKGKKKDLKVVFDDLTFNFKINNLEDFNEQCQLLAPTLDAKTVRTARASFDGKEEAGYVNNSTTAQTTCANTRPILLKMGIISAAETKANLQIARLGKDKKINFKLTFNDAYIVEIKVDNLDDFDEQCKLLSPRLEDYQLSVMRWYMNTNEKANGISTQSMKTAQTCQELRSDLIVNAGLFPAKYYSGLKQVEELSKDKKNKIKIYFDNFVVDFGIENAEDFVNQCSLIAPALEGRNVRNVYLRSDLANTNTSHPSAYFTTAKDSCQAATGLLLNAGIPSKKHTDLAAKIRNLAQGKPYQILATIQKMEVLFGVDNLEELTSQCTLLGDMFDGRTVDTMYLKLNVGQAYMMRLNSYLRSTQDVCNRLRAELITKVPLKVLADIAAKKSQSRTTFVAQFLGNTVTFAFNSENEFALQCNTIITALGAQSGDRIYMSKEGGWEPVNAGYARTPADICTQIGTVAKMGFIPSDDQIEVMGLNRKFTVETVFSGLPFVFKVNSPEQLYGQCLNLTSHLQGIYFVQHRTNGGIMRKIELEGRGMPSATACKLLTQDVKFF